MVAGTRGTGEKFMSWRTGSSTDKTGRVIPKGLTPVTHFLYPDTISLASATTWQLTIQCDVNRNLWGEFRLEPWQIGRPESD